VQDVYETEIGKPVTQPQGFSAFIPHTFPPDDGFTFSPDLLKKDNEATRLLGNGNIKADIIHKYYSY
jgi:hypothetical protein